MICNVRRVVHHYFSKTCSCNTLYSSSNSAKRQSASKRLLHYSGVVLKRVIHVHAVFLQKIHTLVQYFEIFKDSLCRTYWYKITNNCKQQYEYKTQNTTS